MASRLPPWAAASAPPDGGDDDDNEVDDVSSGTDPMMAPDVWCRITCPSSPPDATTAPVWFQATEATRLATGETVGESMSGLEETLCHIFTDAPDAVASSGTDEDDVMTKSGESDTRGRGPGLPGVWEWARKTATAVEGFHHGQNQAGKTPHCMYL